MPVTRTAHPSRTPTTSAGHRRRVGVALAATALGVAALAGCAGGSSTAGGAPATVTVTSTTAPPATTSPGGSASSAAAPSSSAPGAVTTPTGATSGGATAPAGKDQVASGLPTCQPSQMRLTVQAAAGGGSAGHVELELLATNTGTTQCVTQGYPGLSLVAPGSGAQLGAAADRTSGQPSPLLRLEPGKTAVAPFLVAQAADFAACGQTSAAGFRVYLPGTTAAAYVPFPIGACSPGSIHQLQVKPFGA